MFKKIKELDWWNALFSTSLVLSFILLILYLLGNIIEIFQRLIS